MNERSRGNAEETLRPSPVRNKSRKEAEVEAIKRGREDSELFAVILKRSFKSVEMFVSLFLEKAN